MELRTLANLNYVETNVVGEPDDFDLAHVPHKKSTVPCYNSLTAVVGERWSTDVDDVYAHVPICMSGNE